MSSDERALSAPEESATHELANVIASIALFAHQGMKRLETGDPLYEDLRRIFAASEEATELTQELRAKRVSAPQAEVISGPPATAAGPARVATPVGNGAPRDVSPRDQTVLLTDDNEVVRKLGKRVLEEMGYRVLTAENAEDALGIWSRTGGAVDLVVTDLELAGNDGLSLIQKILESNPQTRALLMTGATREGRLSPEALPEGVSFLQKPFTPDALEQAVAAALR